MIIDIILFVLLVIAVIKGIQRGFIVALFSALAIIIGIAAALKLSVFVAGRLKESLDVSDKWMPVVSFLVVFVAVVLLIRLVANLLQSSVEMLWMGWANKLAGAVLYIAIYLFAYSVALFFLTRAGMIENETIQQSATYEYIKPLGPVVIDGLGILIPFFRDMFSELEKFFGNIAQNIPQRQAGM